MRGEWSGSSTSARTPCAWSSPTVAAGARHSREMLHLGADVELHGLDPAGEARRRGAARRRLCRDARAAGAVDLAVLITSPGRQAGNGEELLDVLAAAAGCSTRILSATEEARPRLHRRRRGRRPAAAAPRRRRRRRRRVGAGGRRHPARRPGVAALDRPRLPAADQQTARADPPGHAAIGAARAEAAGYLHGFDPPEPRLALAVGGSARALKRIVGPSLGSRRARGGARAARRTAGGRDRRSASASPPTASAPCLPARRS